MAGRTSGRPAKSGVRGRVGWLLALAWLTLGTSIAAPAAGEPAPAASISVAEGPETRFLIESISIEGAGRVASELVVAESLLTPGSSYTEAELALASYRIRRLPFILDARFALRRGSERGAYRLVITIHETRRFFFGTDHQAVFFEDAVSLAGTDENREISRQAVAGARLFVGSHGVAQAAVQSEDGLELRYTQYNLFRRWVFASAAVAHNRGVTEEVFPLGLDPTFSEWNMESASRLSLAMGFPLGARHSLRLSASLLDGEDASLVPVLQTEAEPGAGGRGAAPQRAAVSHRGLRHEVVELRWIYDTTDDPTLARRGSVATVGLYASTFRAPLQATRLDAATGQPLGEPQPLPVHDSRLAALTASYHHTWPLAHRQALTVGVRGSAGQAEAGPLQFRGMPVEAGRYLSGGGAVEVLHAWDPALPPQARDWGELRVETSFAIGQEETWDGPLETGVGRAELGVAMILRNSWGLFRLGVRYVDLDRGRL